MKFLDVIGLTEEDSLVKVSYPVYNSKNFGFGFSPRMYIQFDTINRAIYPLEKSMMLEPTVPDVILHSSVKISTDKFSRALRAAKQVADPVTISLNAQSFGVNVSGDTDTVNLSFDAEELQDLVCDKPAKSQYSLSLLYPMIKRIESIADTVTLSFNENHPLRLEFDFADQAIRCVYFLAPRIEDIAGSDDAVFFEGTTTNEHGQRQWMNGDGVWWCQDPNGSLKRYEADDQIWVTESN